MADRVPRSSSVLSRLRSWGGTRGVGDGRLGTLLGPEGTGASLLLSGHHGRVFASGRMRGRPDLLAGWGGVVVAADHGEPSGGFSVGSVGSPVA